MSKIELIQGGCLEKMKDIPDGSVDMILCDLPYGTTSCKWDVVIPFEPLWNQYKRIIKDNGAIVLFGNQPFTTLLIASNFEGFKYCWQWDKKIPAGMSYARFRPMQQTEDIAVFTKNGGRSVYYPQMIKRDKPITSGGTKKSESAPIAHKDPLFKRTYEEKQPVTLIQFNKIRRGSLHPTQKPVELCEYLIKTYTNEGNTVLDNCMGSFTTAIACLNTKRSFIGIEKDVHYFKVGKDRLEKHLLVLDYTPEIIYNQV
jgi:site-specific DNA-methyltransferase (adenine-specific)